MRRIVCTADKGGVGKTTTIANTAVRLNELGEKVLVVDVDGQGDATYALLGTRPPLMERGKSTRPSMYALMVEQASFPEVVISAPRYPLIDVLPANKDLDRAPLMIPLERWSSSGSWIPCQPKITILCFLTRLRDGICF